MTVKDLISKYGHILKHQGEDFNIWIFMEHESAYNTLHQDPNDLSGWNKTQVWSTQLPN